MQLAITRTACRERDALVLTNPHLVRPVRFLYPSYEHDATPGWQVDLGLSMYDHLTPVRHRHARVGAEAAAELVPQLGRQGLEFGLLYDDAVADDARLVLAVIGAGMLAGGSALSYGRVEGLIRNAEGRATGARVTDLESGRSHEARASVIVSATGVWTDEVRAMGGQQGRVCGLRAARTYCSPARRCPLISP